MNTNIQLNEGTLRMDSSANPWRRPPRKAPHSTTTLIRADQRSVDGGVLQTSLNFNIGNSEEDRQCRLPQVLEEIGWCLTEGLSLHPSVSLREIEPSEEAIRSVAQLGNSVWEIPVPVTDKGSILDRGEIWALAIRRKRTHLKCLIFQLDQRQALRQIIVNNRQSISLNKFVRVELALEAVPSGSAIAQAHRRRGGRRNPLSKLAEDERVDRRRMVGKLAGAGDGTVPKVEYILNHAIPEVVRAARDDRIKLEAAFRMSKVGPGKQLELLNSHAQQNRRRRMTKLVASQLATLSPTQRSLNEMAFLLEGLKASTEAADLWIQMRTILDEWKERIRTMRGEHETSYPKNPS